MSSLKTKNGYWFDQAASSYQKTIRRGMVEDALFWGTELAAYYGSYAWRRLVVIACEDIGMANLPLVANVLALQPLADARWKLKQDMGPLLRAVIVAMARSPKTRDSDELFHYVQRLRRLGQLHLELPAEAAVILSPRGAKTVLGYPVYAAQRAFELAAAAGETVHAMYWAFEVTSHYNAYFWREFPRVIAGLVGGADPAALQLALALGDVAALFMERSKGRGFDPAILAFAVLLAAESTRDPSFLPLADQAVAEVAAGVRRQVPDFALDKHTVAGRAAGRTIVDFWTTGSQLHPLAWPQRFEAWSPVDGCAGANAKGEEMDCGWHASDNAMPLLAASGTLVAIQPDRPLDEEAPAQLTLEMQ